MIIPFRYTSRHKIVTKEYAPSVLSLYIQLEFTTSDVYIVLLISFHLRMKFMNRATRVKIRYHSPKNFPHSLV